MLSHDSGRGELDRFHCLECGHGWNAIDETDRPRLECPNCGHDSAIEANASRIPADLTQQEGAGHAT